MELVPGLARPTGTITGITTVAEELNGKRLELLQQLVPNLTTVAFLVRADSPATAEHTKLAEHAGRTLRVRLHVVEVRDESDLERAFRAAQDAGALLVADDSVFTAQRTRIAQLALQNHLPTMYGHRDMVLAGGLMTYGPDYGDLYRHAAEHVHNSERSQTKRFAGGAADQVRIHPQYENCQGTRPDHTASTAGSRG